MEQYLVFITAVQYLELLQAHTYTYTHTRITWYNIACMQMMVCRPRSPSVPGPFSRLGEKDHNAAKSCGKKVKTPLEPHVCVCVRGFVPFCWKMTNEVVQEFGEKVAKWDDMIFSVFAL